MATDKDIPDIFRKKTVQKPVSEAETMAQKARQVILGLSDQYLTQTRRDLEALKEMMERVRHTRSDRVRQQIRDDFFVKMHDMKGQGSTFGYPLLTEVGSYACDYLRYKTTIEHTDWEILNQLVVDVDKILTEELTGMGGRAGDEIRSHLGPSV